MLLKAGQVYYEYFNITPSPKNENDKEQNTKSTFPWTPKIILWSFIKSKKPNWTLKGDKWVQRKLSIIKSLLNFTSIFCIVSLIYSLLYFWLDTATQFDTAEATILKIEETQHRIKKFVSFFKIGFSYDILILILLITFASSFAVLDKYKVKDKIKKYNKVIRSILYFLTISTSFTFFGNRLASEEEGKVGKLEIHKLQIIEDNKLLLKKINDAVTEIVVNEIISNPEIEKVLDKIEETKANIEYARQDSVYKNFTSVAPTNVISKLPLEKFKTNYFGKFDFVSGFEKAENKFQNEFSKNSTQSNFYQANQESAFTNFKEKNKSWFNEKGFSESSVKQAEETFVKASEKSTVKYSKYYSKYKDPIEKLIKKGYSNTVSTWIKDFFETLGVDLPFLDELIDPIINEPIQDFILQKTETIFKSCTENNSEAVSFKLVNCSTEFKDIFANKVKSSQKFSKLKEQVMSDFNNSKQISSLTKSEIQKLIGNAEKHLSSISSKSRWERIRQSFLKRVNENNNLDRFTYSQKQNFKKVLNDWNNYKHQQKLKWYFNSTDNLEEQFFNYSKNNGNIKATFGYILQQQDWESAVNYYTNIHPDNKATGKPYYLLKYYYNSIGKGSDFERLYNDETDYHVGKMCPH